MNRSEEIKELATALSKAQGAMEAAKKSEENPYFQSRYADLATVWEVIRKPLADNGLSVVQAPSAVANVVSVITTLLHSSGQWISETLTMTVKDAAPQSIGSAITYGRRYAIMALIGVAAEDDDGENGNDHKERSKQDKTKLREPQVLPVVSISGGVPPGTKPPEQVITVATSVDPPPAINPYSEIMANLSMTVKSKEGPTVALFHTEEKTGWKTKADAARNNPEEMAAILRTLDDLVESRGAIIKAGV